MFSEGGSLTFLTGLLILALSCEARGESCYSFIKTLLWTVSSDDTQRSILGL